MYRGFVKRFLDLTMAIILLVLFSPFFLVIGFLISLDGGNAIFIQERSGKNEKNFKLYKFRTMSVTNNVHNFKKEDEITNLGKFLRKTSLDELPQLINIIKGEMSFIGPRPWITDYSIYFTNNQKRRLEVKPGLTGLAQCSGRNDITIKEKIDLDIKYVENYSFLIDLKILAKSFICVLKRQGTTSSKFLIKEELSELKAQFEKGGI